VEAGNGGRGCVSSGARNPRRSAARRRRWRLGGSVYLKAVEGMNTLADFASPVPTRDRTAKAAAANDARVTAATTFT